jgi:2-isopropylmalate synthase
LHSETPNTTGEFRIGAGAKQLKIRGTGHGLIEALADAISKHFNVRIAVRAFDEHAMTPGTEAKAIASIQLEVDGQQVAACCIDEDSSFATLQATLSAIGRAETVSQRLKAAV